MLSKAMLVGVVSLNPVYKPADNGSESMTVFQISCKVNSFEGEGTERYRVKAQGVVADYIYNNIKKDCSIYLEASIHCVRWVKDGIEQHGMEFHAFTAKAVTNIESDFDVISGLVSANDNRKVSKPKNRPFTPEYEMTKDESCDYAKRWRELLAGHKSRLENEEEKENVIPPETPVVKHSPRTIRPKAENKPSRLDTSNSHISDALSNTYQIINARDSAFLLSGNRSHNPYAEVRG